jgi:hypothetical protein
MSAAGEADLGTSRRGEQREPDDVAINQRAEHVGWMENVAGDATTDPRGWHDPRRQVQT